MLNLILVLSSLAVAAPTAADAPVLNKPAEPVLNKPAESGLAAPAQGELLVDAKVPVEILVDGLVVGQLFGPSELRLPLPVGERKVTVIREGRPEELPIRVEAASQSVVVVGRTGTSVGKRVATGEPPPADGPMALEVRVAGDSGVQLRLGPSRYDLAPEQVMSLELPRGSHPISVRSADGTAIWASGTLGLGAGERAVLQLSEGRMPEITGDATFRASGR